MYDGLWAIEFEASLGYGCGVLVFNGTQVMGGDAGYYYSGKIKTEGKMSGEVNVIRFAPNAISVFGNLDSFTLLIKDGEINESSFTANAFVKGAEKLLIKVKGEKKVEANETS